MRLADNTVVQVHVISRRARVTVLQYLLPSSAQPRPLCPAE